MINLNSYLDGTATSGGTWYSGAPSSGCDPLSIVDNNPSDLGLSTASNTTNVDITLDTNIFGECEESPLVIPGLYEFTYHISGGDCGAPDSCAVIEISILFTPLLLPFSFPLDYVCRVGYNSSPMSQIDFFDIWKRADDITLQLVDSAPNDVKLNSILHTYVQGANCDFISTDPFYAGPYSIDGVLPDLSIWTTGYNGTILTADWDIKGIGSNPDYTGQDVSVIQSQIQSAFDANLHTTAELCREVILTVCNNAVDFVANDVCCASLGLQVVFSPRLFVHNTPLVSMCVDTNSPTGHSVHIQLIDLIPQEYKDYYINNFGSVDGINVNNIDRECDSPSGPCPDTCLATFNGAPLPKIETYVAIQNPNAAFGSPDSVTDGHNFLTGIIPDLNAGGMVIFVDGPGSPPCNDGAINTFFIYGVRYTYGDSRYHTCPISDPITLELLINPEGVLAHIQDSGEPQWVMDTCDTNETIIFSGTNICVDNYGGSTNDIIFSWGWLNPVGTPPAFVGGITNTHTIGLDPSGADPGMYTLQVMVCNNSSFPGSTLSCCETFEQIITVEQCCPDITIEVVGVTTNSCDNLRLIISGGCEPYTYSVQPHPTTGGTLTYTVTDATYNGASPWHIETSQEEPCVSGDYLVTVTDCNGCTSSLTFHYDSCCRDLDEAISLSVTENGCPGQLDALIDFSFINSCDNIAKVELTNCLYPTGKDLYIDLSGGCGVPTITETGFAIDKSDLCATGNTVTLTIYEDDGVTQWINGNTTQLSVVFDADNCFDILVSGDQVNSCSDLTLSATGGTAPYTWKWEPHPVTGGTLTQTQFPFAVNNVINSWDEPEGASGDYLVTVKDSLGVEYSETVSYSSCVNGPTINSVTVTEVGCPTVFDATFDVNITFSCHYKIQVYYDNDVITDPGTLLEESDPPVPAPPFACAFVLVSVGVTVDKDILVTNNNKIRIIIIDKRTGLEYSNTIEATWTANNCP